MAGSVVGLLALLFGLVFTAIAALLGGLCLVGGGILCQGTSIGAIATMLLVPGLVLVAAGLLLLAIARRFRRGEPGAATPSAQAQLAVARATAAAAVRGEPSPRVASECPKCGGPVRPADPACEWCGTPLL
ncbi:MAG TPA: hypothetical protein VGB42_07410 [Candidatus Thermoplasmatota archaeon]